jgi:glucosamine 6-phosphate synthetase-like amidotransferase/phosphosugar isomerase protein
MCGIGGIYRLQNSKSKVSNEYVMALAERLLVNLSVRGLDATGIALIDTFLESIKIVKSPLPARAFLQTKKFKRLRYNGENLILLHCRDASQGSPKYNRNNHPLFSEISKSVLIHNGHIFNWKELKEAEHVSMHSEVDSQIILSLYDKYREISKVLPIMGGSCAIVLFTKNELYLYRNSLPLVIAYLPRYELIVFVSTEDILNQSINEGKYMTQLDFFNEAIKNYSKYIVYSLNENELLSIDFKTETIKSRIIRKNIYMPKSDLRFYSEDGFGPWTN